MLIIKCYIISLAFQKVLNHAFFMLRTLGMIKTSDYSVVIQSLCLYLKLFASPFFALCVAKCGHAFDGVQLI